MSAKIGSCLVKKEDPSAGGLDRGDHGNINDKRFAVKQGQRALWGETTDGTFREKRRKNVECTSRGTSCNGKGREGGGGWAGEDREKMGQRNLVQNLSLS